MKKLLLTGIAALFLATGTAHASAVLYLKCGKVYAQASIHEKGKDKLDWYFNTPPRRLRLERGKTVESSRVNGKRCREIEPAEYTEATQ
jgi:hypothetical protein